MGNGKLTTKTENNVERRIIYDGKKKINEQYVIQQTSENDLNGTIKSVCHVEDCISYTGRKKTDNQLDKERLQAYKNAISKDRELLKICQGKLKIETEEGSIITIVSTTANNMLECLLNRINDIENKIKDLQSADKRVKENYKELDEFIFGKKNRK
jgi:hypothetical protein